MRSEEVTDMPVSRTDVRVKCPFFHFNECIPKKNIRRIICEGIVDASNLVLSYRNTQDYHMQLETYCCEYFDKCEVYRMLMEKYEEV